MNLCNNKSFLNCSSNPHKNSLGSHLDTISKSLDLVFPDCKKMIFLGDFDVTDDKHEIKSFCQNYGNNKKYLIRQPTCYKNSNNPACMDLILTNVPRRFQSTCIVEIGLSGSYLMMLTVMRKRFKK